MLLEQHHGGLRGHSTVTARSLIDYYMGKGVENDILVVLFSTDLSSAFNTVDHEVLLRKLDWYGISGIELKIFRTYLKERINFVEIETKLSN